VRTNLFFWLKGWSGAALLSFMALGGLASCYGGPEEAEQESDVGSVTAALTEDGLADAFTLFSSDFTFTGMNTTFPIGAGYHPGLSTEHVVLANKPPASAKVQLRFSQQQVFATLDGVDTTQSFDLWFVKNVAGSGRTVKPESGDQMLKIGTFDTVFGASKQLTVNVGSNINFDLDMVVVTRGGQTPTASRVLVGSRSLFEKRFFRSQAGIPMDTVSGSLLNTVETTDPLVQRGAFLFFNETFGGNGRTCGTCHRSANNLTLDANFIATLPPSDPLFVYNSKPALAQLESPSFLTSRGLILENVDGFSDPTHKFVLRSVPHLFGLTSSMNILAAQASFPLSPPDNHIGWGGDGAPGRGELNEIGFGAIIQHFTKTLTRNPGVDFRIPAQDELDALEAFMLFSGRQRRPNVSSITFREAKATTGKQDFFGNGLCTQCHRTMTGAIGAGLTDSSANTGVDQRVTDLPLDDGFGQPALNQSLLGTQVFDSPPLIEAADTGPFFHNNSAATIEDAITHYTTPAFLNSPGANAGPNSTFSVAQVADIGVFLRELNAAENVRRTRKNTIFVRDHRSTGNTELITRAIAYCDNALRMLREKNLNANARASLSAARTALVAAQGQADASRSANINTALTKLNTAKTDLLTSDPNNDF
jgi:cytochrome c peroxidase